MKSNSIREFIKLVERHDYSSCRIWTLLTELSIKLYDAKRIDIFVVDPHRNSAKQIFSTSPHVKDIGVETNLLRENDRLTCFNCSDIVEINGRSAISDLFYNSNELIYSGYESSALIPIMYLNKLVGVMIYFYDNNVCIKHHTANLRLIMNSIAPYIFDSYDFSNSKKMKGREVKFIFNDFPIE